MNSNILIKAESVAKKSMIHIFLLASLKLVIGFFTGISVMMADAVKTYSELLGLFASYIGLHLSRKSADQNFEYGYYKIETFAAFLVSIGLLYVGFIFFRDSITLLYSPQKGSHQPFAITAAIISIIHYYNLRKKLQKAGEEANSLSLITNARGKNINIFLQVGIIIAIISNYQKIPYVEGIITIIVSILILKEGFFSAKESLFFLLDYWGDPIMTSKIKKILKSEKGFIRSIKKIRLRRAGTFIFGEAYVEINPFIEVQDLREELKILSEKISELNPYIKDFPIYSHIPHADYMKVAIPVSSGADLSACISHNFQNTTAYIFAEIKKNKIINFYLKKIAAKDKNPLEFANFLKNEKITTLINNKIHSLAYYNLRRTHQISIYPVFLDVKNAKQALDLLLIDV